MVKKHTWKQGGEARQTLIDKIRNKSEDYPYLFSLELLICFPSRTPIMFYLIWFYVRYLPCRFLLNCMMLESIYRSLQNSSATSLLPAVDENHTGSFNCCWEDATPWSKPWCDPYVPRCANTCPCVCYTYIQCHMV